SGAGWLAGLLRSHPPGHGRVPLLPVPPRPGRSASPTASARHLAAAATAGLAGDLARGGTALPRLLVALSAGGRADRGLPLLLRRVKRAHDLLRPLGSVSLDTSPDHEPPCGKLRNRLAQLAAGSRAER